jgi:hypothetical protein
MVWACFKNEQGRLQKELLNMKLKRKFPRIKVRSRWELVRKDVRQKEGGKTQVETG